MPRVLALFTALALVVSGCGADEDSPGLEGAAEVPLADCEPGLEEITVTGGPDEKPTVEFSKPFSVGSTQCTILDSGDGDEVAEGDHVLFDIVLINGRSGEEYGSTYEQSSTVYLVNRDMLRGIRQGLIGNRVGSRVLVAIAAEDAFGLQGGDPDAGLEEDDTLIAVIDIHEIREVLERAEGAPVAPVAGLPAVTLAENGAPTIVAPPGEPPATLVVQPLIEGTGPVVELGQTITAHYHGIIWASGLTFGSSWEEGLSDEFQIGVQRVIAGWDKGLVGQRVGSQVLLVVPPADGYGAEGRPAQEEGGVGITGTDTLVFVVDILDARS